MLRLITIELAKQNHQRLQMQSYHAFTQSDRSVDYKPKLIEARSPKCFSECDQRSQLRCSSARLDAFTEYIEPEFPGDFGSQLIGVSIESLHLKHCTVLTDHSSEYR